MDPLVWNDLPDINEVSKLDRADMQCLEAIKELLQQHNKSRRFGVTLLHQHFMLDDDELLVEHCDLENRKLVTRPEKDRDHIRTNYLPTTWRFDGHLPQACAYCPPTGDGAHYGYKENH